MRAWFHRAILGHQQIPFKQIRFDRAIPEQYALRCSCGKEFPE